jgi:hypothetical protein
MILFGNIDLTAMARKHRKCKKGTSKITLLRKGALRAISLG